MSHLTTPVRPSTTARPPEAATAMDTAGTARTDDTDGTADTATRLALDALREQVLQANLALPRHGLVLFTWGNVSGVDRARGWMAIKPSGVAYERLRREDIVVLALADGARVAGTLKPSSDTATHLHLYRRWPAIGGIVHTHSTHATAWAQAGQAIPALGTTHADYFHGEVPCSRPLRPDEIARDYEGATGEVIVETLADRDPLGCPGLLVSEHAPFAWGRDAEQAVHHAAVLEEVARLALYTRQLDPARRAIGAHLLDKHYLRKHGPGAYYGQAGPGDPRDPSDPQDPLPSGMPTTPQAAR